MKNNVNFKQIEKVLDELSKLIKNQKTDKKQISQLDIDLAKEKVRKIYDVLLNISFTEEVTTSPSNNENEENQTVVIKSEPEVEMTRIETNVKIEEGEDPGVTKKKDQEKPVIEKTDQDEIVKKASAPGSIDLFSDPKRDEKVSVVDKISENQQSESVAEKIQKDKTTSLKLAIGINDKFYFINELFDGNMKEYNDTIDKLDSFETLNDAYEYLNSLIEKYKWAKDLDAYIQLVGFIDKKLK